MKKTPGPPHTWKQWLEYFWLILSNPTFRESKNRRRAYYEYRLAKSLNRRIS